MVIEVERVFAALDLNWLAAVSQKSLINNLKDQHEAIQNHGAAESKWRFRVVLLTLFWSRVPCSAVHLAACNVSSGLSTNSLGADRTEQQDGCRLPRPLSHYNYPGLMGSLTVNMEQDGDEMVMRWKGRTSGAFVVLELSEP